MKKIIFSTMIASLLAFVGCQNEELVNENTSNGGEKVILTANIQGAADSRVALTPDTDNEGNPIVKVEWNESGETFEVYGSNGYSTFTQIPGTNQFEGTLPESADGEYEACYGDPSSLVEQDGKLGQSTANDSPVLMSAEFNSSSPSITFEHVTAILKPTFKVNGEAINNTITKIVMGDLAFALGGTPEYRKITIAPTSPATTLAGVIYIHLPIMIDYTDGDTFNFTVTAGGKEYTGSLTIPTRMSIEAGKLYTATIELEEVKDLEYIATSNTFIVKTAAGLQHLNEWMTGTKSTSDFKAIGFAGNQYIADEASLADALEMNITFMADITLDAPDEDMSNWTAIGTYTNPYTGTIDGNGKTLGGMVINATENCQGFVGYLGTNGKIKNLTFANAQVVTSEVNAGIVAGYNYGIVENCHTIGTSSVKGDSYVGGIVGYNLDGTITNCTNAAQVVATNQIWSNVGGITGENQNVVSFCINSGSVSGSTSVGGIVGYQKYYGEEVIVIACGNTGSVSGSTCVGGIVGWNTESNAIASWTITTAEMNISGATTGTNDGVGQNYNANIPACYSVADAAALNSEVSNMNTALRNYYNTNNAYNTYYWTPDTNGGWPTLTTEEPTIMPG